MQFVRFSTKSTSGRANYRKVYWHTGIQRSAPKVPCRRTLSPASKPCLAHPWSRVADYLCGNPAENVAHKIFTLGESISGSAPIEFSEVPAATRNNRPVRSAVWRHWSLTVSAKGLEARLLAQTLAPGALPVPGALSPVRISNWKGTGSPIRTEVSELQRHRS